MSDIRTITLAGGCFWCMEAVFQQIEGVTEVVSGYIGGHTPRPDYEQVCTGATGHAEAVQVRYDAARLPLRALLEVFFSSHDPTTPNRQGHDVGTQYRSGIFYHDTAQAAEARRLIAELDAAHLWPGRIVTEVTPASTFYPAESYHQNYYANNARQPYCQIVVAPKVAHVRQAFGGRVKAGAG